MNLDHDEKRVDLDPDRVIGSQEPSFISRPPKKAVDFFDGEDFVDLAAAFGLEADPWQELIVKEIMARGEDGRLVAPYFGLSVPRQNGKNAILEIIELGQMIILERHILHTSHEVKTNRKSFTRLKGFFENYPELKAYVRSIRNTNGQEAIFLHNGGAIEFISRSKTSARGFTGDTLVLDEAQHLTKETLESLTPALSTSPDPHYIFTGTPPSPTDAHGEAFRDLHDDGHSGADPQLLWAEWSAVPQPGDVEIDADDEVLWVAANPALGRRIRLDTVQGERRRLSDDGFRRERLGLWEQERTARVIPLEDWQACADANLEDSGAPVVLGVDVSLDRDAASIVAAGTTTEGRVWVDVIENRRGVTDWVIPRLKAILANQEVRAVMIDVLSPAGSFIDPLEADGIKISRTGSNILASGCGQLYDAVMSHDFRHLDQMPLNLAAASARKRKLGDSWAWNRANEDADVTPLVAASLAMVGQTYQKSRRPVKRRRERRKVIVW